MKKKICYILPKFDLETDTHYFYLYDFINTAALELDIDLIIEQGKSDYSYFSNVKKIRVQIFGWLPLRIVELFILVLWRRLAGYKNFYVHYSFFGALLSKFLGGKVWYWNCGLPWLYGEQKILKKVLDKIDFLVTGNQTMAKLYNKVFGLDLDKIKIMPNWIDLARFENLNLNEIKEKYKLSNNKNYVLFIHHLSERKGAHYLAPISKNLENIQNLEILVAGTGPYEHKLRDETANLKNIRLLGKVPNKEVPTLMKLSYIFLMPSDEEGMPRVLLESMAAGLPYVASDIGGVREMTSQYSQDYICPVGDIGCFVSGIKTLNANKDIYEMVKQANFENIQNYELAKVVKIFVSLFNE